jgi:hypothetical protein
MKPLKRVGIAPFPAKQQVRVPIERPRGVKDRNLYVGMKVYVGTDGTLIARKTQPKAGKLIGVIIDTGLVQPNYKICPECREVICTCCGKCHNQKCGRYMQVQTILELLEERYPLLEMKL